MRFTFFSIKSFLFPKSFFFFFLLEYQLFHVVRSTFSGFPLRSLSDKAAPCWLDSYHFFRLRLISPMSGGSVWPCPWVIFRREYRIAANRRIGHVKLDGFLVLRLILPVGWLRGYFQHPRSPLLIFRPSFSIRGPSNLIPIKFPSFSASLCGSPTSWRSIKRLFFTKVEHSLQPSAQISRLAALSLSSMAKVRSF